MLLAADTQYAIGTFDGTTFTPSKVDYQGIWVAGSMLHKLIATFPLLMVDAFKSVGFKLKPRACLSINRLTVPIEMNLISTEDGPRLRYSPVTELQSLRSKTYQPIVTELKPGDANPFKMLRLLIELRMEFEPSSDAVLKST